MTERDKQIIDLYLNHPEYSNKDIADKFNVSINTISRIARINNLPRRKGGGGVRLSLQDEYDIIKQYSNFVPKISIQEKYNISYDRLQNILAKYQIENNSLSKMLNPNLKEDYFNNIDEPSKAYWLGWIISDGTITHNTKKCKHQLELTIKEEDEHILHLLEKDLGISNKVYQYNICYRRFSLGCKKIVEDLISLGITQNKTFTVKIPEIPKQFYPNLILGIFDGDGGYTVYRRSNGQLSRELSFCGNEYVVSWIRETLLNEIENLKPKKIEQENSIKRIRWGSLKDIRLISNYLYTNCGKHYLKRKRDLIYADTEVTN